MCGIAGIRRFDATAVDRQALLDMAGLLRHRGPDALETWCDDAIGFAHTRLSIIDLPGSRQPMASPNEQHHLVFNGEILNYRELRSKSPYPFRTQGDTEVLLALYADHGPQSVNYLRGQFAYAIHDADSQRTHLFRDRLGILPLYYYLDKDVFAFASEIKALLPIISSIAIDPDSLNDYLAHRTVPSPHTFIRGIRKLPQGHILTVEPSGHLRLNKYWQLPDRPTNRGISIPTAVKRVDHALQDSVRDALVADVPVGVYLSGGLDSSLLTALARRQNPNHALHTYCAKFGEGPQDESSWARRVASLFNSDHHEVSVTPDDFLQNWTKLSWHRDGPLSDPADVAIFRLAQEARQQVKVILSGEGSDELFGGYSKYLFANASRWFGLAPFAHTLGRAEHVLPHSWARMGIAMRALSESNHPERMRGWFAPFTQVERQRLTGTHASRGIPEPYTWRPGDGLYRMLYADTATWLADNLLERGDRMSMAASIETRPPYLDYRLVELAFELPSSVKVRRTTTKWLIKQLAYKYLPAEIVDRPKIGFKVPLDRWFRLGLRDMAHDLLTGPSSYVANTLDNTMVTKLLRDHSSGRRNEEPRIWTLLSLEVWHRELVREHRLAM